MRGLLVAVTITAPDGEVVKLGTEPELCHNTHVLTLAKQNQQLRSSLYAE